MGQYYYICNLDKKQYLHPHKFGDGLKLLEFGCSAGGTMTGLAILLADGNGRGGGDLYSDNPIIGSWKGNRVVISGDYADAGTFPEEAHGMNIHMSTDCSEWEDISAKVIVAMCDDQWLREDLEKRTSWKTHGPVADEAFVEIEGI